MEFDREQDEKRQRARKNLGIYLAEFDDDYESSRCEFFYDRSRWLHKRDRDLKKEQDADNKDRNMDDDERQFAQSQEQESAARAEDRVAAAREQAEKEDVEEMVIDQPEGFIVTRIMTKEERIAAIQELVATIPATKEELWEWPVKWQFMDDVILSKKLGPFLSKKVIEIVGDEEKDLVDFILENIKSCADCQSIFDELEPVICFIT